jgi:branched-chain amino acid transport system substrate-binding protein
MRTTPTKQDAMIKGRNMTKKTAKFGSISGRRLLTTVSAGAAFAASPFRNNLLESQEANIKIGFPSH